MRIAIAVFMALVLFIAILPANASLKARWYRNENMNLIQNSKEPVSYSNNNSNKARWYGTTQSTTKMKIEESEKVYKNLTFSAPLKIENYTSPDLSAVAYDNKIDFIWRSEDYIFYKKFDGNQWSKTTPLESDPNPSYHPKVARIGNATHLVWSDKMYGNFEILYKRSDGSEWTQTRGSNIPISDISRDSWMYAPMIVYNSENREYLVAWYTPERYDADGVSHRCSIWGQRISPEGTRIGENFPLIDGYNGYPSLVYNPATNEYLLSYSYISGWMDLAVAFLNSTGNIVRNVVIANNSNYDEKASMIAYNPVQSEYLIVYMEEISLYLDKERIAATRIDLEGNILGSFIIRNETLGLRISEDSLVYNPTNNQYLVAWVDERNENYDVWAQIIDGNGNLIGGEIVVANTSANEAHPRVIYNSVDNEYLIAWHVKESDNIYGQRIDTTGKPIGSSFLIGNGFSWTMSYNNMRNEYLFVRSANLTGNYEIYAQRFKSDGQPIGTEVRITYASGNKGRPRAIFNPFENEYFIIWVDARANRTYIGGLGGSTNLTAYDIYGQRLSATGELLFGNPNNFEGRITNDPAWSGEPAITGNDTDLYIFWIDGRTGRDEIFYSQAKTDRWWEWSSPKMVDRSSSPVGWKWKTTNLTIRIDPFDVLAVDGDLHLVWVEYKDGFNGIYYSKAFDQVWSAPRLLSTWGADSLKASLVRTNDALHLLWYENATGQFQLKHRRSIDGGLSWSDAQTLADLNCSNSWTIPPLELSKPAVAGFDDDVYVAWTDSDDGLFFLHSHGKEFSPPIRLNESANGVAIGIDAKDDVYIFWNNWDGIYYITSENTPPNIFCWHKDLKEDSEPFDLWSCVEDREQLDEELRYNISIVNQTINPVYGIDNSSLIKIIDNRYLYIQPNLSGTAVLNLTVTDPAGLSANREIQINILEIDDPPVLQLPNITFNEDDGIFLNLSEFVTDIDTPQEELVANYYNNNPKIHVEWVDPLAFYLSADENWNGVTNLSVCVHDNKNRTCQNITVTILPVNDPPTITVIPSDDLIIYETGTVRYSVIGNDVDRDVLTYSVSPLPSGAEFKDQKFTWTPDFTQAGIYYITFTVSDGNLTANKTVMLTVENVNRPPVMQPIEKKTIKENELLTFTLNAIDPDNDNLSFYANYLPDGASLDPKTGIFSWKPNYAQAGSYQIIFFVSDGEYESSQPASIEVQDVPVPDPMLLTSRTKIYKSGTSVYVRFVIANMGEVSASNIKWKIDSDSPDEDPSGYVSLAVGKQAIIYASLRYRNHGTYHPTIQLIFGDELTKDNNIQRLEVVV